MSFQRCSAACVVACLALLLASCGPRDLQTQAALVGRWEGHVAWRDATTPLVLDIGRDGDSLVAFYGAPALGVEHASAGRLAYDAPRVHFVIADSSASIAFDGWLRRGLVVGAFSSPLLGETRNPALLPQLSLRQRTTARRQAPWPDSIVGAAPPVARAPERSLAEWLGARAGR